MVTVHLCIPTICRVLHKNLVDFILSLVQDEFDPSVSKYFQAADQLDPLKVQPVDSEKLDHLRISDRFPDGSAQIIFAFITISQDTPAIMNRLAFFQCPECNRILFKVLQDILRKLIIITPGRPGPGREVFRDHYLLCGCILCFLIGCGHGLGSRHECNLVFVNYLLLHQ